MNCINRVRGTQDSIDTSLFDYLIHQLTSHMQLHNFSQNSTPIIEHLQLFKRSLGDETDVVSKEMFIIQSREESSEVLCLRPEATAPTMRSYLEHKHLLAQPWKTFSYGAMFRYERPQRGRYRQFHQANIEIINSASWTQDVQLLSALERFFSEKLALNDYVLSINFLGCSADREIFKHHLSEFLSDHITILCSTCVIRKEKNILRIFDCKQLQCKQLYMQAPVLLQSLCACCTQEWNIIKEQLEHLAISYVITTTLVRGFDYYDKIVFEFSTIHLGAQNAFCGGGRYNGLAQQLGYNESVPSVGAALGIERIMLMLEKQSKNFLTQHPLLFIIPLQETDITYCLLLADHLRAQSLRTDIALQASIKHMMRQADKLNASYAIIVGSDERNANSVSLKNMQTGEQALVNNAHLVEYITQRLKQ